MLHCTPSRKWYTDKIPWIDQYIDQPMHPRCWSIQHHLLNHILISPRKLVPGGSSAVPKWSRSLDYFLECYSSYVGSSYALPHPWGIPHRLVHWDMAAFPLHIPCFPIDLVFCGKLWRWLHRLEPFPQTPRLLPYLAYHSFACVIVLLWPEMPQPFYEPTRCTPWFSVQTWMCSK